MKICLNNIFNDLDLTPFLKLLSNVFNQDIEIGTIENSDILFESVFGDTSFLYSKTWLYSFLFIGESDRRLSIFMNNGLQNERLKDYSCILKGKSENDTTTVNVINFPLFILYSYCFKFIYQFEKHFHNETRFNSIVTNKISNIPNKNICVIISNGHDSEGRNFFLDELDKKVKVDYAGNYKNNVERVKDFHCSPGFIDFISNYKIIITMENSKNDNYITEKILQGFAANIIPVYWGANNVLKYFNEERFINVKSFDINDINEAIDKIMMIINNDEKYLEIINKPVYVNNTIPLTITDISLDIKELLNIENRQYKKFITFGGPTSNYHDSVKRICIEAQNLCFFDEIKGFTELDLKNDELFWEKHGNFIQNNPRGYGYWLWKSYLIKKELEKINENDILIFCDAGCQINMNGKKRLLEYIDMLNTNKENYGIISFQLEFKAIQYTKNEVFEYFNLDEISKNMSQFVAGILIMKKNTHSIDIINKWYDSCENHHLINDDIKNESPYFIDNRHDQSILSILVNKHDSIKLLDETYFHPNWETDGSKYPFWAKRIK